MKRLAILAAGIALLAGCSSDPQKNRAFLEGFGGVGTIFKDLYDLRTVEEKEEIQIGEGVAATLLGARPLVDDPALQKYVNDVGLIIARHSERPDLPWVFGVTDSDHVNAFATPGGNVLVTRGLIRALRNESELAGVLAHEIAHVTQKHHLRAMRKSALVNIVSTTAGVAAATQGAAELGSAIASATKELYLRGLDRDDEFEADRLGVVYAARAGYDAFGLAGVMQTLSAAPNDDAYVALLFKTHPLPADRLAKLSEAMGVRFEDCCGRPKDDMEFQQRTAWTRAAD